MASASECLNGQSTSGCAINDHFPCSFTRVLPGTAGRPGAGAQWPFVPGPVLLRVAVSVSSVSDRLFTRLPVINDGKQVFLKRSRDV